MIPTRECTYIRQYQAQKHQFIMVKVGGGLLLLLLLPLRFLNLCLRPRADFDSASRRPRGSIVYIFRNVRIASATGRLFILARAGRLLSRPVNAPDSTHQRRRNNYAIVSCCHRMCSHDYIRRAPASFARLIDGHFRCGCCITRANTHTRARPMTVELTTNGAARAPPICPTVRC